MKPKKILIVDDDQAIVHVLSVLLIRAGYAVVSAQNGQESLAVLTMQQVDLVVLDIMLPGIDGLEVCRRVRNAEQYVPVVMLTARDELTDKLIGIEAGADVYLTKPFEPRELLAHVKALFRLLEHAHDRRNVRELPLVCGPLTAWPSQRRIELHNQPLDLTPTEQELLLCLMRDPGRAFGRETLLRQVWGYAYDGDSRTVDVHIQRLRAKVETDPAQPDLIRTVRGFGYRLVTPEELERTDRWNSLRDNLT